MSDTDPMARIAEDLVRRGLGAPAVFMLEAMKPLSVVAQQTVLVTSPLASLIGFGRAFGDLALVLENRQRMEDLAVEIEGLLEKPRAASAEVAAP